MSYTLKNQLSPKANIVELADFWEIECLRKVDGRASLTDISQSIGIMEDHQENESDREDTKKDEKLTDLVFEIERRIKHGGGNYPYELSNKGNVLSINRSVKQEWTWWYLFMLFATRNNMKDNKTKKGVDGTQIFEQICINPLLNYFGRASNGFIFGTAGQGNFKSNLAAVLNLIQDGVQDIDSKNSYNPQDDKIDLIVWRPFSDSLVSKLICFSQCKTGTNWRGEIHKLSIPDFQKKWLRKGFRLNPISSFMVADILSPNEFYDRTGENLFFDRIRITSLFVLKKKDAECFKKLLFWTKEIMTEFKLSLN